MSALYPYPAVQYIPLAFRILFRQEDVPTRPFILIGQEISTQQELVADHFGVHLPALKENADQLLLLVGGFEPLEVKYRGFYVTIKARVSPMVSLLSLPTNYFYKESLVFQAKTENGDLLGTKAYKLPSRRRYSPRVTY